MLAHRLPVTTHDDGRGDRSRRVVEIAEDDHRSGVVHDLLEDEEAQSRRFRGTKDEGSRLAEGLLARIMFRRLRIPDRPLGLRWTTNTVDVVPLAGSSTTRVRRTGRLDLPTAARGHRPPRPPRRECGVGRNHILTVMENLRVAPGLRVEAFVQTLRRALDDKAMPTELRRDLQYLDDDDTKPVPRSLPSLALWVEETLQQHILVEELPAVADLGPRWPEGRLVPGRREGVPRAPPGNPCPTMP
jgi:hypothetical protein